MRSAAKAHGAGAELRARVAHARETYAAPTEQFDPTLPGLLSKDPPGAAVELLEEMAADVRPENMTVQLSVMAEADQRDLPAGIAVPTLLVWGAQDARSLLSVARQFELAIPDRADGVFASCERPPLESVWHWVPGQIRAQPSADRLDM